MNGEIIRAGNKTDHSGVVLYDIPRTYLDGRQIAWVSNLAKCTKCKKGLPMIDDAAHCTVNGMPVALHGIHLDGQELVGFERDNLHRETIRTQGNRLTQSQTYDAAGRLLEQTLSHLDRTTAYVNRRKYRYDQAGQLTDISDTRRGSLSYRYDPVGRLLQANSALGQETFDFDPAGNLLEDPTLRTFAADPATGRPAFASRLSGRNALVDNLLKEYAGTHYEWSTRGNLMTRTVNGHTARFTWDAFNRLTGYSDPYRKVEYHYDALGRRIYKQSQAHYSENLNDGEVYRRTQRALRNKELGCGTTLYGWDGDTLAWETRWEADVMKEGAWHPSPGPSRTTHYLYEPNSFVPLAQATRHGTIPLHKQPDYAEAEYDLNADPLWQFEIEPTPFDSLAWYQCDHLGTPQELTDEQGEIAWSAQYKAWGAAQEVISDAARSAGIQNPIRFQGQYFDHETGLHYNRHRYYDPGSGRYISQDPIGLSGGYNLYAYANGNPLSNIDPMGTDWRTAIGMTADWITGRGPADRTYGPQTSSTQEMMPARRVQEARQYWYKKNAKALSAGKCTSTPLAPVTGYKGSFGLADLFWYAGLNPTQQFVGSYRIDIYPIDGDQIKFELTNNSSMKSFLYGVGPDWERSVIPYFGNMRQTYTWTEPIRR